MTIHPLALSQLTQLIGGMALATARFQQGDDPSDIIRDIHPTLPLDAENGILTAMAPLRELLAADGGAEPGSESVAAPEAVALAFFRSAQQLEELTQESHPQIASLAANFRQVWRRGLSYPPQGESPADTAPESRAVEAELVAQLRRFIENSPEPMGVIKCHEDGSAELVMFNRRNRTLWGLGENNLVGFSVFNFFYPEDVEMMRGFILECLRDGNATRTGIRIRRKSGGHFEVDMYAGLIENTRYAYIHVINETRREQALGQNRIFEAVLRHAREPLALFKFDENGNPTGILTSSGFNEMLGYRPGEMDGRPVAEFIPAHLRGVFSTRLRQFRATGVFDWKGAELLARGGKTVLVDIFAKASEVGGSKFAVASFGDAASRIAAERDAAEAQKLDIIASVTAGIAHDAKNMLTIIIGGLDLFRMKNRDDDLVSSMMEKADMLNRMFDRFRQLTDTAVKEGSIDVHSILSESDIRLATPKSRDVQIDFDLEDDPWTVAGPAFSVWQIAFNIIKNAVEAMEKSEVKRLSVSTENITILDDHALRRLDPSNSFPNAKPGDFLKLTIEDTGGGIPSEIMGRIFEDYFSTKNGGDVSRGRGLSTSRRAVAERGGLLLVRSQVGAGAAFDIYLPRTEARSSSPQAAAAAQAILPDSSFVSPGGEVILVADDDAAIRNQFERVLKFYRYQEIILVGTSDEVLEVARQRPDLTAIVMDWRMPGMTGDELLRELHTLNPRLPILVNTGLVPAHQSPFGNVQFVQKLTGATRVAGTLRSLIRGKKVFP